jgi:hypothetical protein
MIITRQTIKIKTQIINIIIIRNKYKKIKKKKKLL